MPDVYASIESADEAVQERLAEVLELRAADAAQQAMLEDYLADLPLPDGARVLEVGCGTGAVALAVDRGADTLVAAGRLGAPAAEALKAEAAPRGGRRVLRPHRLREPDRSAPVTDDVDARLRAFARLLVRTGVNLSEGQELLVHAQHEHAPFVRAHRATRPTRAGARFVDVAYADRWVQRAFVESAPDEMLGWTPPWMVARLERAIEVGAAIIGVSADSGAEVYEGLDGDRLARARFRDFDRVWMEGVMGRKLAVVARRLPDRGLGARGARRARRRPPVGRLRARPAPRRARSRRGVGGAPGRAPGPRARAHRARRSPRCATAAPGTDLEVGLIEGARWLAGRERTVHGQVHAPNLPDRGGLHEPAPRARRGHGPQHDAARAARRRSSRASSCALAGGEIVEARATPRRGRRCAPSSRIDDGARRFGEVALVDASSRVGETGVIFNNTLFDENAAAHIAWGNALPVGARPRPARTSTPPPASTSPRPTPTSWSAHREVEIDGVEPGRRGGAAAARGDLAALGGRPRRAAALRGEVHHGPLILPSMMQFARATPPRARAARPPAASPRAARRPGSARPPRRPARPAPGPGRRARSRRKPRRS